MVVNGSPVKASAEPDVMSLILWSSGPQVKGSMGLCCIVSNGTICIVDVSDDSGIVGAGVADAASDRMGLIGCVSVDYTSKVFAVAGSRGLGACGQRF